VSGAQTTLGSTGVGGIKAAGLFLPQDFTAPQCGSEKLELLVSCCCSGTIGTECELDIAHKGEVSVSMKYLHPRDQ